MIRPGIARRAFRLACERDVPALSEQVWHELVEVLHRPKLARFVDTSARDEMLELLRSLGVWFDPEDRVADCRDAKDNKYLELALAAGAAIIVSSDQDLRVLHPWRGVNILLPAHYLASS